MRVAHRWQQVVEQPRVLDLRDCVRFLPHAQQVSVADLLRAVMILNDTMDVAVGELI